MSDPSITVWLIEHADDRRMATQYHLDRTENISCPRAFGNSSAAVDLLETHANPDHPDVILVSGDETKGQLVSHLARLKSAVPEVRCVISADWEDEAVILESIKNGASGFISVDAPFDRLIQTVRETHQGGFSMPRTVAERVMHVLRSTEPRSGDHGLTDRELEVLRLVASGRKRREIADELAISLSTVSTHLRHIHEKLEVKSSPAAVAKAVRQRIL